MHTFGLRVRKRKHGVFARRFQKGQKRGKHNRGGPDDQKTLTLKWSRPSALPLVVKGGPYGP